MVKPHGKTSFQDSWFADPDFKVWLKKSQNDPYSAECLLCPGTKFSIASMGRRALTSHMQGQKHKLKAEARKKAPDLNVFFQSAKSKPIPMEQPSTSFSGINMPSTSSSGLNMPSTSSSGQTNIEIGPTSASCLSQPSLPSSFDSPRGLKK